MKSTIRCLDTLFSGFVYATILLLAVYMTLRIAAGADSFFDAMHASHGLFEEILEGEASKRALQSIAETLILVKAYKILVSYVKTHHISVEYIVEISIIAPAIELLFASHMYSISTQIILGVFGLTNLFIYVHYFGPEHDEELHAAHRRHSK